MSKKTKGGDEVLGYDEKGKPIFGYAIEGKNKGIPCCYSRLPGRNHLRCQSIARMKNGRCIKHGGNHPSGTAHHNFKTGLYAKGFKDKSRVKTLIEATQDPHYMELGDEMALNTIEISTLTGLMGDGLDPEQIKRLLYILGQMETIWFSKKYQAYFTAMKEEGINVSSFANLIEEAVQISRAGCNELKLHDRIGEAVERRRKLVETESKRVQMERNNMPADQVLHLFGQIVDVVTEVFQHDEVGIKAFAAKIDQMSGLSNTGGNQALGGRPGVMGMVEPQSALTTRARNIGEAITVEDESEDFSHLPTTQRKFRTQG